MGVQLFNKYRPKTFEDVCGQETVVRILSTMVLNDKIPTGLLLEGNRGLGKTTLAKIFSKAINCTDLDDDGNPCNECVYCKSINEGKSMDVVELDAASNRGVDTVREKIINKVNFQPHGKRKVFILDEVHMFTQEAWNALLKTLEEPPSYCVFILCTTNHEKIPKTIISRVQRFTLKDMTNDDIVHRLEHIAKIEKIKATSDALYAIARYAKGGMRDSISALDQLSTDGEKITVESVSEVFGLLSDDVVLNLFELVVSKDLKEAVGLVIEVGNSGKNVFDLFDGMSKMLRTCAKISIGINIAKDSSSSDISPELSEKLQSICDKLKYSEIIRITKVLIENERDFKFAADKQLAMICLLSNMVKGNDSSIPSNIAERLNEIERKLADVIASGGVHSVDVGNTISNIRKLVGDTVSTDSVSSADDVGSDEVHPSNIEADEELSSFLKISKGRVK